MGGMQTQGTQGPRDDRESLPEKFSNTHLPSRDVFGVSRPEAMSVAGAIITAAELGALAGVSFGERAPYAVAAACSAVVGAGIVALDQARLPPPDTYGKRQLQPVPVYTQLGEQRRRAGLDPLEAERYPGRVRDLSVLCAVTAIAANAGSLASSVLGPQGVAIGLCVGGLVGLGWYLGHFKANRPR